MSRTRLTRRGLSLVELLATLAIVSVLMAALGSTVLLASRALPREDSATVHEVTAARVLEQIAAELAEATDVEMVNAHELEFEVPGREAGDDPTDPADDDTIKYIWSGTPGDSLTRQYNGGTVETVLESVESLNFTAQTVSQSDAGGEAPLVASAEQQLQQFSISTTIPIMTRIRIEDGARVAQQIAPDLPADATHWRPTRAAVYLGPLSPVNAGDTLRVSVQPNGGMGAPNGAVMAEDTVQETSLTGSTWHYVTFSSLFDLPASSTYFLVVEHTGGGAAAEISTARPKSGVTTGPYYQDDDGDGWAQVSNRVLWLYIWGTPLSPDPDWTPGSSDAVASVTITLNTGPTSLTEARTSAPLLNRPDAP